MHLIDSNILIYSAKPDFAYLRTYIASTNYVSLISKVEVLGFHKLIEKDKIYFNACFNTLLNLEIDRNVIENAILIRSSYNLSLGDSLIASTALLFNLELVTNNIIDFKSVNGLKILSPVK